MFSLREDTLRKDGKEGEAVLEAEEDTNYNVTEKLKDSQINLNEEYYEEGRAEAKNDLVFIHRTKVQFIQSLEVNFGSNLLNCFNIYVPLERELPVPVHAVR